jgi:hypothetical protein
MCFNILPNEIIEKILLYTKCECTYINKNILLTCKKFHSICFLKPKKPGYQFYQSSKNYHYNKENIKIQLSIKNYITIDREIRPLIFIIHAKKEKEKEKEKKEINMKEYQQKMANIRKYYKFINEIKIFCHKYNLKINICENDGIEYIQNINEISNYCKTQTHAADIFNFLARYKNKKN